MTPEARCPACGKYAFVDDFGAGSIVRVHGSQDLAVRARATEPRPGKPYGVPIPRCPGSEQRPKAGTMRWPNGDPCLGEKAQVVVRWPGGTIAWESM